MLLIENAKVVTEKGIIWDGAILTDKGRILQVGRKADLDIPENVETIDAKGLYAGPGFVDIHVHGGNGYDFGHNPEETAQHFLAHGETTVLATFFRKYDRKTIEESIVCTKEAIKNGKAAKIIAGFYMEGPYLSDEFGSTAQTNPWRGEIKEEDYSNIVNLVGDLGRVWAVAPERDGIEGFMKYAKSVNPNTLFAVGHSMATPSHILKLKKYGIKIQTHCMDATQRVSEWAGTRGAGPDEYCMTEPDMYAELISDSMAIHVNPTLQRLILRTKGIEKVILISDSTISNGPPPEGLKHITDLNFGPTSGLSGSKLTLNVACRNIMAYTNCGIAQAFMMASGNPARALGLDDEIGTLDVGKKANIVFVDDEFNVHKVMFEGELVKE